MIEEFNDRPGWAYHNEVEIQNPPPKRLLTPLVWRLLALALLLAVLAAAAFLTASYGVFPWIANDQVGRAADPLVQLMAIQPPPLPEVPK